MFTLAALENDTFSWQAALSLAFASKLAYEPSGTVESIALQNWGFRQHVILDRGDTQGFIAIADRVALIAFRGTESLGDWIGNLQVIPERRPFGLVHSGFMAAYRLVDADVRVALSQNIGNRKLWLTGHSLGGALATIAAAELHGAANVAGIHTYGQPRLGDAMMRTFYNANYQDRLWRFVNDRDLVTRVPPGYEHAGRLVHFDEDGNVKVPVTEAAAVTAEPPPYTEAQYEELRAEIRKHQLALRSQGRSEREAVLDRTVEGLFPSLSDHRLERYIAIIQRQTGSISVDSALAAELSIRAADEALEAAGGPVARRRRDQAVPVLIRLKQVGWKPPPGLDIESRIGNLLSARGNADVVRQLEVDPDIDRIEFSRETGRPELVQSVPFVGGDVVHRPPLAERGDQALVGLIDSGIDVLHEAFRDEQSRTRILAVWNQRDNTGPSPNTRDSAHFPQTAGTLYLASDIADFIAGLRPTPPALRDPDLHGTHVASIAAGRAARSLPDGMAPDAGIVVVIPKMKTNPGDPFSVGYSSSHFEALAFLKAVADGGTVVSAARRPMAVNVSLGMNAGAHDGSSLLEASFDAISNQGRVPGFVIVKSAGNERGFGGHARLQAINGVLPVEWESDQRFRFQDYFEVWYQAFDELEFTLIDPAGNTSASVSRTNKDVSQTLGSNLCHLVLEELCKDNGDSRLTFTISPATAPIQGGKWKLNILGAQVRSRFPQVDIWVERDDSSRAVRFIPEVPETTLSIPGTANTVVTVAACHSTAPLQPLPESSFGPTRKGLPKPDIAAPGFNIVAAKGADADLRATIAMSGTSMAAPHVTGALALVLSSRHKKPGLPQYNARQLLAAVTRTAKFSGLHSPSVGHGLLDADALYRLLV